MKRKIKQCIINCSQLCWLHNWLLNRFHMLHGNHFSCLSLLKHSKITVNGTGNSILIGKSDNVNVVKIFINGNNNIINISENVLCKDLDIWIEDDNNHIIIGPQTVFAGHVRLSVIEGTEIKIGEGCLFADYIDHRTGDAHSIIDPE